MFEKVNPSHPDKVADRIAGALVDYAYTQDEKPRIAVEVLIGHGEALIIAETSVHIPTEHVEATVQRIAGACRVKYVEVPQDPNLAANQQKEIRCGDNGIFKGCPTTYEQNKLTEITAEIYKQYPTDGKNIIFIRGAFEKYTTGMIICQSNIEYGQNARLERELKKSGVLSCINPIGSWTGGVNTDSGATNRKLGSDMGDAVTGGGLHGKDLSKADVSVNIVCHLMAKEMGMEVKALCAIGDEEVEFYTGGPVVSIGYEKIVQTAHEYINSIGGFEKLAEWGLIRP